MEKHANNTWREPRSGRLWLKDDLPAVTPLARIFAYEYDASAVFGEDQETFVKGATRLLDDLRMKRIDDQNRPLIFLGHSLGGFLIQQALVNASSNPMCSHIANAV